MLASLNCVNLLVVPDQDKLHHLSVISDITLVKKGASASARFGVKLGGYLLVRFGCESEGVADSARGVYRCVGTVLKNTIRFGWG